MRSTPVITKTASAMRRSVDDLRAWQDRKNASVRELRRRRDEYEDRVHNTFAPRMSKGSVAIERERRNAALGKYRPTGHSPGHSPVTSSHKSPVSNDEPYRRERGHELFDDETSAGVTRGVTRERCLFSRAARAKSPHGAHADADDSSGCVEQRRVERRGCDGGGVGGSRDGGRRRAASRGRRPREGPSRRRRRRLRANTAERVRNLSSVGTGRRTSTRNSMGTSIRNSVRVPRAAAGHYTRNPAAVPRSR